MRLLISEGSITSGVDTAKDMTYVTLPTAKVVEIAHTTIRRLDAEVEVFIQEHIAQERSKFERRAASWWGRLLHLRVPTDTEIRTEHLAATNGVHSLFEPHTFYAMYGYGTREVAERVLRSAQTAQMMKAWDIQVSSEDLAVLG